MIDLRSLMQEMKKTGLEPEYIYDRCPLQPLPPG